MNKAATGIYFIFGFGVLWHSISYTLPYVLAITPLVLFFSYFIVLYPEIKSGNYRTLIWLSGVYIVTVIIEWAGTYTGIIFGDYYYGDTLGKKVLGVPMIIGLNWGMIIWGVSEAVDKFKIHSVFQIIAAALLAVLLDMLIEPAAMKLDYWYWDAGIIPLKNYAAWGIITAVFSVSYFLLGIKASGSLPVHFYAAQVMFFGIVNLIKV